MDQHEYVLGCQRYYAENYYEPGNPEDGEWHDCHYPAPACLGGTTIIKLLKQHHAVQGVLQSEEYGRPCIYGWEGKLLPDHYLDLFNKWMTEKAKPGQQAAKMSWSQVDKDEFRLIQSQRGKKYWDGLSLEERGEVMKERYLCLSEEQKVNRINKIQRTKRERGTMVPPSRDTPVTVTYLDGSTVDYNSIKETVVALGCSRTSFYRHIQGKGSTPALKDIRINVRRR